MSVRQRVLRSAPADRVRPGDRLPGPEPGRIRPRRSPGLGAEPVNQPAGQSVRAGRRRFRPRPVHQPRAGRRGCSLLGLAVVNLLLVGPPARARSRSARRSASCSSLIVAAGFIHKLAPGARAQPARRQRRLRRAPWSRSSSKLHFGLAGMILILAAAGLFGLALCHDVLFVWPVQEMRGWIRESMAAQARRAPARAARRAARP